MKYLKYIAFLLIFAPLFSQAQVSGSLWKLSSNSLFPVNSTWSLTIPQLGGSGTSCVQVNNSGLLQVTGSSCGGSGGSTFPFTPTSYGNSTSTTIGFLNGLISNGSTTIPGLGSGLVGSNNGLLYGGIGTSTFVGTVSTSSQENINEVPFFTTHNGYPAKLSGSLDFQWDNTNDILSIATSSGNSSFFKTGGSLEIDTGGDGNTLLGIASDAKSAGSVGGGFFFAAGLGSTTGRGGNVEFDAGNASQNSVNGTGGGGSISLIAGDGGANGSTAGGNVILQGGIGMGGGSNGNIEIFDRSGSVNAIFDTHLLSSSNKTFTFPNTSGTFCLTSTCSTFGYPFPNNATSTSLTFNAQTNFLGPLVIGTSTASTTIWGNAATSTFASGISLTNGGCFAINGTCLTPGLIGGGATQGVNWATTGVLSGTPTYSNGVSGVGATLTEVGNGALSVDSNNPASGDRVLVKNQASAFQNGIYTVTQTGSAIAVYILTRATDYNQPSEITPGITTYVLSGTVNSDSTWAVSYTAPLSIGSTNLNYSEAAGTNGTVTSIATNNGLTGGTITTSGTIGLANVIANSVMVNNTSASTFPTALATSTFGNTLFGVGTGGQILAEQSSGVPIWTATTTFNAPLTYSGGSVSCASCSTFAWPFTAINGTSVSTSSGIVINASSTIGTGSVTGGLTVSGTATTSNFIDTSVTSALALFDANHKQGAFAGSNCSAGSAPTGINANGSVNGCTVYSTSGTYPFTPSTFGINVSATTTPILDYNGLIAATSTIGVFTASSSITNQGVKSALVLNSATGLEGAYGGANCTSNQFLTSITATGGCTSSAVTGSFFGNVSANTVFGNFTGASATPGFTATSSLFTFPWSIANGGTNATSFTTSGNVVYYDGTRLSTALTTASVTTPFASTTALTSSQSAWFATSGGSVGVASTTPFSRFSVGTGAASSSITVAEYKYGITGNVATSTTANIDCNASTQIAWPLGASATTLTLINMTPGKTCRVAVQNPNGTAGAVTWAITPGILMWAKGTGTGLSVTAPTQDTTANSISTYSFISSEGSSTIETIGVAIQ